MTKRPRDENNTLGTKGGPLDGIRVIELGHFIAAPFCARLLADLGAEVIKVEPPSGDPVREWGLKKDGNSIWWSVHGRNKQTVTANLKTEAGRQIVIDLVKQSDVLIENFRAGHLAQLGLSDEVLREANQRLIIAHVSGFGQTGPDKDRSGFGAIGEAMGGLRYLTNHASGTTDLPPVRVGISIGDSIAGMYAAIGIISGLWQRDHVGGTNQGQPVDVALTESVLSMMEGLIPEHSVLGVVREPVGARIPTAAPTSAYRSADGKWIVIAANSQPLFASLCTVMERPELSEDPRFRDNQSRVNNVDALDDAIQSWTEGLDIEQIEAALVKGNIPASRIYNAEDIALDRQYRARGMVHEVEDPLIGRVSHPGVVPHMPESERHLCWTGRKIGADSDTILSTLLGMSKERIEELRREGAI